MINWIIILLVIVAFLYFNNQKEKLTEIIFSSPSCGIANNDNNCYTCDDIINAYKKNGLIYNKRHFGHCKSN